MFIRQLQLSNFKNHEKKIFSFTEKMIAFVGLNGVGKTNCLDAIYFLCIGKSYFTSKDSLCIKSGESFFRIEMQTDDKVVSVAMQEGKKKLIQLDKELISRLSNFVGKFPVVMIAPNDNQLILGGSEERRIFIDQTLSQSDATYLEQLMQYNKVLKQRNALLKQAEDKGLNKTLLNIYNEDLNKYALYIYKKRVAFAKQIMTMFNQSYAFLSTDAEQVAFTYKSDLEQGNFLEKLEKNLEKDLLLRRTTKGIHKDDLVFELNTMSLKDFGSQGQQKTYLLALKLSQFDYLKNSCGITPVFMVDDIFDKLDAKRSEKLLLFLQKEQGQVFISNTTSSIFDTFRVNQIQFIEII